MILREDSRDPWASLRYHEFVFWYLTTEFVVGFLGGEVDEVFRGIRGLKLQEIQASERWSNQESGD